jgi:hypothetical protein
MHKAQSAKLTAEYYVLRIYRRYAKPVPCEEALVGLVEDMDGKQRAFHNEHELWQLLLVDPAPEGDMG